MDSSPRDLRAAAAAFRRSIIRHAVSDLRAQVQSNSASALSQDYAFRAEAALAISTDYDTDSDVETHVGDLLANLMHFCARNDVNFNEALRRGKNHYSQEQGLSWTPNPSYPQRRNP
jgi:hypothetical protein